ncbi:hypothetical protein E0H70_11010 [Rhizobium leguminosarum bv. viciae]|nr:hypothetical protein E0H70_11010 [Rhizobium leguminosarum bv. viciae]
MKLMVRPPFAADSFSRNSRQNRFALCLAKPLRSFAGIAPEHDAEKCERFSDDIMLSLYHVEQDSNFRPTRPKIILF